MGKDYTGIFVTISIIILSITVVILACVCIVGRKKEVSRTQYVDKVFIYDAYHRAAWTQPISAGKIHTIIVHPAINEVYVKYDKCKFTIYGNDAYEYAKDHMDSFVDANITKIQYDDGASKIIINGFK